MMAFFRFVFFVVLLFIALTLAGTAIVVMFGKEGTLTALIGGTAGDTKRFSDRALGISFRYPSQWKISYAGSDTVRFSHERHAVVLTVTKEEKERALTLEEYTKENLKEITESAEHEGLTFVLKESLATTLSGNPAHRLSSLMQKDGETLQAFQIWSIANGRVYSLSYSAPGGEGETAVKTFDTLIQTVVIKR